MKVVYMMSRCLLFIGIIGIAHSTDLNTYFRLCRENDIDAIKVTLNKLPSYLNEIGPGGQTCVMSAVLSGAIDNVNYLLLLGVDTTIGEKDGYTPVHGAGFQGRSRIMEKLIAHGLDPNDRHSDGYTPLHRAAWGREDRHTATVYALLKAGVDKNQKDSKGLTAVQMTQNVASRKLLEAWGDKRAMDALEDNYDEL